MPALRDVLARTATRATLGAECANRGTKTPEKAYVFGVLQAEDTSILMPNKLGESMRVELLPATAFNVTSANISCPGGWRHSRLQVWSEWCLVRSSFFYLEGFKRMTLFSSFRALSQCLLHIPVVTAKRHMNPVLSALPANISSNDYSTPVYRILSPAAI
jgi:hypothetical protein